MRRILGLFSAVVLAASETGAQSVLAVQSSNTARFSLNVENASVPAALDAISRASGVTVTYDSRVASLKKQVTVRNKSISLADALAVVLRNTGLEYVNAQTGSGVWIRPAVVSAKKLQGIISGKITDAKTGKGLSGANVSLDNDAGKVTTGEDGHYRLSGIDAGTHVITVRSLGYAKQTRSVTLAEGASVTADFKLDPSTSVLNQIVVTGTSVATELKAVPSAITVVTAKDIEQRGITRIDQLFHGDIPGLFSVNLGSNNPLDSVVMFSRGASSFAPNSVNAATNPIKTYVDGVELANPFYLSQVDPRSIERIEILTGPQASTIYGSNAINGVMQIFTKRGFSAQSQLSLSLLEGFVENNQTTALTPQHSYSGQLNGTQSRVSYNVGGSWDYMGPWSPSRQTERLGGFGALRFQASQLAVDGSFRAGNTYNRATGSGNFDFITAQFTHAGPTKGTLTGRTAGITVTYTPLPRWSNQVVVGRDISNTEYVRTAPSYGGTIGSDTLLFFSQNSAARTSYAYTTNTSFDISDNFKTSFVAGADRWNSISTSANATPNSLIGTLANISSLNRQPRHNTGMFTQGQLSIHDELFLTYGLRAEWNPNYGETSNPSFAPRYGFAYTKDFGFITAKLRGSYGRATRPPTDDQKLEQIVTGSTTTVASTYVRQFANPDLEPEYQQGGEGGIELYIANRGSLVVTRYNQTVDNLITKVTQDSVISTPVLFPLLGYIKTGPNMNVGSIRNQGWELHGSVNIGPFTTTGTYSWNTSKIIGISPKYRNLVTGSQYLPGSVFNYLPDHTWAIGETYSNASTSVSLHVNGTSFMYRNSDEIFLLSTGGAARLYQERPRTAVPLGYKSKGKGYAMADLNVTQRFLARIDGILQIQNIGDFYQNDVGVNFATLGRQIKVGARAKF